MTPTKLKHGYRLSDVLKVSLTNSYDSVEEEVNKDENEVSDELERGIGCRPGSFDESESSSCKLVGNIATLPGRNPMDSGLLQEERRGINSIALNYVLLCLSLL